MTAVSATGRRVRVLKPEKQFRCSSCDELLKPWERPAVVKFGQETLAPQAVCDVCLGREPGKAA